MSEDKWSGARTARADFGDIDVDFKSPPVTCLGTWPPASRKSHPQIVVAFALVAWSSIGHQAKSRTAPLHEHRASAVVSRLVGVFLSMAITLREGPKTALEICCCGAPKSLNNLFPIPGHALHEKSFQRQLGAGQLASSLERRAPEVPRVNRSL